MRKRISPGFLCTAALGLAAIVATLAGPPSGAAITGTHRALVVLCNFQNQQVTPEPRGYFQQMFGQEGDGKLGAFDFWQDVSYGNFRADATVVGWYTIPMTRDNFAALPRDEKWKRCAERAAGDVDYDAFTGIVVIVPEAAGFTASTIDSDDTTVTLSSRSGDEAYFPTPPFTLLVGGQEWVKVTAVSGLTFTIERGQPNPAGGPPSTAMAHSAATTVQVAGSDLFGFSPGAVTLGGATRILGGSFGTHSIPLSLHLHEEGHLFGVEHSMAMSTAPNDYSDCYDLMSTESGCSAMFAGTGPTAGMAFGDRHFQYCRGTPACKGPGLNSIQVDSQGWLPAARTSTLDTSSCRQQTYEMAALNRPEKSGLLQLRIPASVQIPASGGAMINSEYYSVELRAAVDWDRGIPADAFVLHLKGSNGRSYLLDRDPGGTPVGPLGDGALWAGGVYVDAARKAYVAVNSINGDDYTGVVTLGSCKLVADLDYVGATSGQFSDAVSLAANLTVDGSDAPVPNANVVLTLGSQICTDRTDANGRAECSLTLAQTPGPYTVTASYAGNSAYQSASDSASFTIEKEDTVLTYTGATTKDYHDPFTASGTLLDDDGDAVGGRALSFTLGVGDTCTATTNGLGFASCSIVPTQKAGTYTLASSFADDGYYESSSDSDSFEITHEESTTTYTGPTVVLAGSGVTATVKAQLVEDGANDDDGDGGPFTASPSGQTITLALGSQSCTATTNASGVAQCSVSVPTDALGPQTASATFAGDDYYRPSSDSTSVIVFAFPSRGAFVLGDSTVSSATPTTRVTWWDDAWWRLNSLSGGTAPDSFKGFADTVSSLPTTSPANFCGTTFRTLPGNSPPPTRGVPSYMGVLVASSVTKSGNTINGNWAKIVVVRTDAGYAPRPGAPGTGSIVATFCP